MGGTRRHKRSVSIVDVALLAGVSRQTVSRVLNNPESVRPDTQKRVKQAILETGYHRNENARALKSSTSNSIGVLASASKQFGPSELLWGVEKAAAEQDYSVKTSLLKNGKSQDVKRAVGRLLEYDVSAIIVIATETWIEPLVQIVSNLPIVSIGSAQAKENRFSVIDTDQKQGICALSDHLVEQGVRRVDHVSGPQGWYSSEARLEGWIESTSSHSLVAGRVYRGDWSEKSGYEAGLAMVDDLPDAVIVANDQMAMGVIRAFHDCGVDVPGDIMVSGFDGAPMGAFMIPTLTTLKQSFLQMSEQAVTCAIEMIHGADMKKVLLEPELIIRESTTRI